MLILRKRLPPSVPGVGGNINPAALRPVGYIATPGREIQVFRIARIDGQTVGPIHIFRKLEPGPVLSAVRRAVERSVSVVSDAAVLSAPRNDEVQGARGIAAESPRQRFTAGEAIVFQRPVLPAIAGLVHAPSERAHVEHTRAGGTLGI